MQGVLQNKYYNIRNLEKYLVQTWSQVKSSGIKLPDIHGVGKSLDLNVQPEKQVKKPMITRLKDISQIKPRLGQGKAELRCKIKTSITKPIVQAVEKSFKIPGITKT